tara:strand:- start:904 stop:2127 length:1224 start_codon:yes stop_codon:yes gene_type:complete
MIKSIVDCENSTKLFDKDINGRKINYYLLKEASFGSQRMLYPDVTIWDSINGKFYNPIQEKTMSLQKLQTFDGSAQQVVLDEGAVVKEGSFFYFVYNTQNYYHFLYDTLPYLITFLKLSKKITNLKLLMNYPDCDKKTFFPFVLECLEILGIKDRIEILDSKTIYKKLYVSDSYTHGPDSNLPPRQEVFEFFKMFKQKALSVSKQYNHPKKIYVSRRAWIHNKLDNIGTDYTNRRRLINESDLVNKIQKKDFVEIFTENMCMVEKVALFHNAEEIAGIIGGGLANCVFSRPTTKLYTIVSPGFLDCNSRFLFSFKGCNLKLINSTKHVEDTEYKKFMRVSYGKNYGEIYSVEGDYLQINQANNKVSGWANHMTYKKVKVHKNKCIKLDHGLNSPFVLDIDKCMREIK